MAVGGPDAVASRVAATDDENFLALAVDDAFRRNGDPFEDAVLLRQQFESEMDAFQVAPFDGEVARHFGADGDADGIERRGDLFRRHFAADHRIDFEHDPFLLHQPDAAVEDVLP